MTERLYLHVGSPKSGTTFLQRVLDQNRERLAAEGVLVVGETLVDRVNAGLVIREDARAASLPPHGRTAWDRLTRDVREWTGEAAVFSYELLAAAGEAQAAAVLERFADLEVHVVISSRNLAAAVPSAWQERLKFAARQPFEQFVPGPAGSGPRAEWSWRTLDPAAVARRWGATLPPERVHVVTAPRDRSDPLALWRRFAEACALDAVTGLDTAVDPVNESLGVVASALLLRVNGHVGPPFDTSRRKAVWLRDTLAHRVLAPLDAERIGITDAQLAAATEVADRAVRTIEERGYRVHGDLGDLRAVRPVGRTPAQVGADEVVDLAARALVRMLELLRGRTVEDREDAGGGPRDLGKRLVRRLAAPYVDRGRDDLAREVVALRAEVAASRALQLRVAELTDVVTELLLPATASDGEVLREALKDYRARTL